MNRREWFLCLPISLITIHAGKKNKVFDLRIQGDDFSIHEHAILLSELTNYDSVSTALIKIGLELSSA